MKKSVQKRVFVAMSGGVDSSIAALLLKKQGYDVTGIFMKCWTWPSTRIYADKNADLRGSLSDCAERDAEDARRVAEKIGIPFYIWNFEKEYKKRVVQYMIDGYRKGITPNPDVMCNKEIKFGLFLEKALKLGADYVATGHYVRLRNTKLVRKYENKKLKTHYSLLTARDSNKDQSYFLWTLTQEQLKHCLFPIGDYLKSEVRQIAKKAGIPTAEKKDSQGICFLGKVTLEDFLKKYIPEKPGAIITAEGKKIGEHKGVQFYTIGQRHLRIKNYELRIKGRHETKPLYVAEKDAKKNTLIVAEGDANPALYKNEIELINTNFINPITNYQLPITVYARVRYRQSLAKAKLINLKLKTYKLIFKQPQKFIAPGQSAVFYSSHGPASAKAMAGKEMLGGGIIKESRI